MTAVVEAILRSAIRLPPFPQVAQKALALLEDPDVAVAQLVAVIELDANLTGTVLKASNSALLSRGQRIDNLKQALARLGLRPFRELVFASASAPLLSGTLAGYGLSAGDLWRHSLATGLMTQVLSERLGHKASPALYTGALLHDLGKTILGSFVQEEAERVAASIVDGKSALEAERSVLGMDHAELGARIVERWNFSPEMAELLRFHHEPEARPEAIEVAILALANQLCQLYGLGAGLDGLAQHTHAGVVERLKLKRRDIDGALAELHVRVERASGLVGLAPAAR
jgi:putative nucleotidyltransferase with HDIG domain